MTVLASFTFESDTHNAEPAGWTSPGAIGKTKDKTIETSVGIPVGNKSLAFSSDGDYSYITSISTTLGDQGARCVQKVSSLTELAGILLRGTVGSQNGYRFDIDHSGGNLRGRIIYYNSGSTVLGASSYNIPVAVNDLVHMKARAIGNALSLWVWTNSNPEPSSPTVTATHSGYTTGAIGARKCIGSLSWQATDQFVATDGAGGEDFFYPATGGGAKSSLNFVRHNPNRTF